MVGTCLLYLNPLSGQEIEEEQNLSWLQTLNIQSPFHLVHHCLISFSESQWWALSNDVDGKEQEKPLNCYTVALAVLSKVQYDLTVALLLETEFTLPLVVLSWPAPLRTCAKATA